MVKYVIVLEKSGFFFASLFQNISKTAETILLKKIKQNHGVLIYKKALMCEHRKNYIFRDTVESQKLGTR